jgi:hypothetical protein
MCFSLLLFASVYGLSVFLMTEDVKEGRFAAGWTGREWEKERIRKR